MKTEAIKALIEHIKSECNAIDREARFDDMLNDCYSFKAIGGPFQYMQPSQVLKVMDPTAYRCGVNDYADSEEWYEIDSESYDRREVDKAHEDYADELDGQGSNLEIELEEAEEDLELGTAGVTVGTVAAIKRKLDDLRTALTEVKSYTF